MLRVGLTGGIGSGKSTVAQDLTQCGAVVIDADELAREVVAPGSRGLSAIAARFGDEILDDEGALNRPALGAVVFADAQARQALESITHPLIARRTAELVAAAPADAVVVHDVPLLVEKQLGADYHLVLNVGAAELTRIHRLGQRRGMTEQDARSRIAAQADDAARRTAADVWLDNDGSRDDLRGAVEALWRERLVPFERHVRERVCSIRPEVLTLREPDPTWPAQAARVLARVRAALGPVALTADHVGSTAVPGLLAKDVLDLQIGVRSLDDVDAQDVRARLDRAGFPRAHGDFEDADRGSVGSWPKRMHGNADPARVVHIHVREVGSPGWRWALEFRDWMRADAAAREEYAALKRSLAATGASTSAYTQAKEPWFDDVHARVRTWAEQTGWTPEPAPLGQAES